MRASMPLPRKPCCGPSLGRSYGDSTARFLRWIYIPISEELSALLHCKPTIVAWYTK